VRKSGAPRPFSSPSGFLETFASQSAREALVCLGLHSDSGRRSGARADRTNPRAAALRASRFAPTSRRSRVKRRRLDGACTGRILRQAVQGETPPDDYCFVESWASQHGRRQPVADRAQGHLLRQGRPTHQFRAHWADRRGFLWISAAADYHALEFRLVRRRRTQTGADSHQGTGTCSESRVIGMRHRAEAAI
jgi:hypothetical protein